MDFENDVENEKIVLEQQFILRLPHEEAIKLRNLLDTKPSKVKKSLKLDLNLDDNSGIVKFGKRKLYGCLRKFPTIIESYKTHDKVTICKTADINQVLICDFEKNDNKKLNFMHGITPPLKNVKKKRFRKTLINTERAVEVENIERELYYLLRTDLEAVSSKYEVTYEQDKENRPNNSELNLFGNISSETSDEED
ncbi:transcription initiation factor TFIID subunit 7 isoform X2 [Coccinella septempunctata]|uniref:transcription initiation factor TFIID subunit 7 isoform X2 n=1 Tax=Coccinella septempunctata TaxID=41139 RepID=UPI001D0878CB|nr:transcription initiation factor TFIID subunit 7 isoform X2 [Coccinella septempunctata]